MNDRRDGFDLDELLHPAQAFERPSDVVNDPDLTLNEKRAILASWASDACAVESAPALRAWAASSATATFDDVMDTLRALDEVDFGKPKRKRRAGKQVRSRLPGTRRRLVQRRQATTAVRWRPFGAIRQ